MSSIKDSIIAFIKQHGPKSDREIAAHFNLKQPSVRRARGELVTAKQLEPAEKSDEKRWQLPAGEKKETPPAEAAPRFKHEPDPVPADKKDWRATGFTF